MQITTAPAKQHHLDHTDHTDQEDICLERSVDQQVISGDLPEVCNSSSFGAPCTAVAY